MKPTTTPAPSPSSAGPPAGPRILVIDDDESLRDTIAVMLERENFIPIVASDGKSGLDKALTLNPHLLLVDLRLPGMSGVEVCKQLRADRIQTPIIVLSAIGDEVDKVLLLEIGADDYIVKPFGTRELLARIRALLRRSIPETKIFTTGNCKRLLGIVPAVAEAAIKMAR